MIKQHDVKRLIKAFDDFQESYKNDERIFYKSLETFKSEPYYMNEPTDDKISAFAIEYALKEGLKRSYTQKMACITPQGAIDFALKVDKCPTEYTSVAACRIPKCALDYAKYVDKCVSSNTYRSAKKNAKILKEYEEYFHIKGK